jgi:hypothetical protein
MEHKGVEYSIVQLAEGAGWRWEIRFADGKRKSGVTPVSRAVAIKQAEREIDRTLKSKKWACLPLLALEYGTGQTSQRIHEPIQMHLNHGVPGNIRWWGLRVADYRAYTVGLDGHFTGFEPLICADDAEAIARATQLVDGHDIELWSGQRLVARLKAVPKP